jgi:hypothetical protein
MQQPIPLPLVAKGVAALGTLLAFIAIWVDALPTQSYWGGDGTTGVFCLLLVLGVAAFLALSVVRPDPQPELIAAVLAFTMWGHYVFVPAALASHSEFIEAGGWLGLIGGAFAALGTAVAYGFRYAGTPLTLTRPAGPPPTPPQPVLTGLVLAALGLVLSYPAIWLDASSAGSYWNGLSLGHGLGVVLLLALLALTAVLAIVFALGGTVLLGPAAAVSFLVFGIFLFGPVDAAFGNLGELKAGAWLGFFGGALLAGGTLFAFLASREALTAAQAAAPAAAPAQPAAPAPPPAAAPAPAAAAPPAAAAAPAPPPPPPPAAEAAPPPAPAPTPSQPTVATPLPVEATLVWLEGTTAARRIPIVAEITLGRENADLVLEDDLVSRRHAAVRPVDGGAEITDLGSSNGTFVNRARIQGSQRLNDGDTVNIGRVQFQVEISSRRS